MKKVKIISIVLISVMLVVFGMFKLNDKENLSIYQILETEYYSYLPVEAKEYVQENYSETGEVILTEKNKEENELYLNPQYVVYLSLSDEEKAEVEEIPIAMIVDYIYDEIATDYILPSSYDLRDVNGNNYVAPVRDQGSLGICWAFATAGVVETYLLNDSETSYDETSTLISERQIDYITSIDGIADYDSEYVSFVERELGGGGNFYISTIAMANGVSLTDYDSFKEYDDTDLSEMELYEVINYENSEFEVNATINFPTLSLRESTGNLTTEEEATRESYLNEVKENIISNGAAYVNTYVNSTCLYLDSENNLLIDVYNCSETGSHAMEIIGWDDDYEYSYCADTLSHSTDISACSNIVSGTGAWILKNSWGDSYQYPYLTYDSLYTSIFFIDDMSLSSEKEWENNYIIGDGAYYYSLKTYSLSDYDLLEGENLEQIKFITGTQDTEFFVTVKQSDGSSVIYSQFVEMPGLTTFTFDEEILVDENTEILISGDMFIDRVSFFTSNIAEEPYVFIAEEFLNQNTEYNVEYNNFTRLYSETKNISSGESLVYELYDSNNENVSESINVSNNIVAENNVNTLIDFSNISSSGVYTLNILYDNEILASTNITFNSMEGLGTINDPYIITTPAQLDYIRYDLDAYYELGNDIDLTEATSPGGSLSLTSDTCGGDFGWQSINDFTGSLDGNGYSIIGLSQNNYTTCTTGAITYKEWNLNGSGLFNSAYGDVTIKNLVLEDFDIKCSEGHCAALLSDYDAKNYDWSDTTEYEAVFENIVLINSEIGAVSNTKDTVYGGGLFSYFNSDYGTIEISNIYLNFELNTDSITSTAYLANIISGSSNIENIYVGGDLQGKYSDGSGDSGLVNKLYGTTVQNVISTITGTNLGGIMSNYMYSFNGITSSYTNVNLLNIENTSLYYSSYVGSSEEILFENVNIFDKDSELSELTNIESYEDWDDFDENWIIETIDGIDRIPVLKFMDFEYTSIDDIYIEQELNIYENIYDYIYPDFDAAIRITFESNDESIAIIEEDGTIIPQKSGETTIHIESYYDGYINDVPITIEYEPHYTIIFDSNEGSGEMENVDVEYNETYQLKTNEFTRDYYNFVEWNTEADGTGESYTDLSEIGPFDDKTEITLYAQWLGDEKTVIFDAGDGTVEPSEKTGNIFSIIGELPIPEKEGYGFKYWYYNTGQTYYSFTSYDELPFVAEDTITLTAVWAEEGSHTIVYNANGGSVEEENVQILASDGVYLMSKTVATTTSETLYDNIYIKDGYHFVEWNTEADGTGISYVYIDEAEVLLENIETDTFNLYAIWEADITYEIDGYEVDDIYINDIKDGTLVSEYLENITLGTNYTVEVDTKIINGEEIIYTGGKTSIYENEILITEYTNVVKGDLNGDGLVGIADIAKAYQHFKKITVITESYYLSAGTVTGNSDITIGDIAKLYQYFKGSIDEL